MQDHYTIEKIWPKLIPFFAKETRIYAGKTEKTKRFVEAVIWILRSGSPWRMLPREYGKWNTVFARYNEWAAKEIWVRLFEFCIQNPSLELISIDSTIIRAHACAAGYEREGNDKHALGRSKGGFTTKIHMAVDGRGLPIKILITPGQRSDITQAPALISELKDALIIGDKAFDSDKFRAQIVAQGCVPIIPPRSNRKSPISYDKTMYKHRHVVECFVSKFKQMRRVFSRFDKSLRNFTAFVALAAALLWLR